MGLKEKQMLNKLDSALKQLNLKAKPSFDDSTLRAMLKLISSKNKTIWKLKNKKSQRQSKLANSSKWLMLLVLRQSKQWHLLEIIIKSKCSNHLDSLLLLLQMVEIRSIYFKQLPVLFLRLNQL